MFNLQKLLWDIRKDPSLATAFKTDPASVLDAYDVHGEERDAMRTLDFKRLYDRGANPYLLYFCALQIGVERAEYYAQVRGQSS